MEAGKNARVARGTAKSCGFSAVPHVERNVIGALEAREHDIPVRLPVTKINDAFPRVDSFEINYCMEGKSAGKIHCERRKGDVVAAGANKFKSLGSVTPREAIHQGAIQIAG
jgi:hypothetical protein